jgi:transcription elongation factor Elf1
MVEPLTEAEVDKGGTEWTCLGCGHVTTIDLDHHPGTARCEGCGDIMQDEREPNDREEHHESYESWEERSSSEFDDPMEW